MATKTLDLDESLEEMWTAFQITASFMLAGQVLGNGIPPSSSIPASGGIQNTRFTYDSVGNITQIQETSAYGLGRTVAYGYDDLYRLTSASTTAASSTPYTETYAYNAIGDLTSKTGNGSFTYAGTGNANPHAATTIGGKTLTYDNNGSVTAYSGNSYTWDYRNRLTKAATSTNTFYTYDHTNMRVSKGPGASATNATTTYPNMYWNLEGSATSTGTTTRQVYANGELIATIQVKGATTTKDYVHPDWLGSTAAITDSTGAMTQTLDYYPYGKERINSQTGQKSSFKESRKFIGQEVDDSDKLNYLQNRYLDNLRGQFLSEDPVFWEVGLTQDGRKALINPQAQNSYSYGLNNPIRLKDPDGRWFQEVLSGRQSYGDFRLELGQATQQLTQNSRVWDFAVSHPVISGIGIGIGAGVGTQALGAPAVLTGMDYYGLYSSWSQYLQQVSQPSNYSEGQLRFSGGNAFLSGAGLVVGAFTPAPVKYVYSALSSILGSAANISYGVNGLQTNTSANQSSQKSLSGAQAGSFVQLTKAFTPQNQAQAKALEGVFNAFSKK